MIADDPRDAGTTTALTSAGTSDSPTITTTIDPSVSPSRTPGATTSSSSSLQQPHTYVPPVPKLPQGRFSFEYQLPLRRRTLASHTSSLIDTPSVPNPTPSSHRTFMYDRPRRSIPSFSLSHGRPPKESVSLPPSPRFTLDRDPESALAPDADSTVKTLSPNATKRRKDSFYAQQTPPNVKRRMPSSATIYTQEGILGDRSRIVNGVDRHTLEVSGRTSVADDTRSKNEDIFLNIARSDAGRRESLGRSELRR
ncbi:hypothetical protein BDV25DRAFT_146216, partial [Aspergillus avenaceus]